MKYSELVKTKEYQELINKLKGMCGSEEMFTYSVEELHDYYQKSNLVPLRVNLEPYIEIICEANGNIFNINITYNNPKDNWYLEKEVTPDAISFKLHRTNIILGFDFLPTNQLA